MPPKRKTLADPLPPSAAERLDVALSDVRALLSWVRQPNASLSPNTLRFVDDEMLATAENAMAYIDTLLADLSAEEATRTRAVVERTVDTVKDALHSELSMADTDATRDALRAVEVALDAARDDVDML